MGIRGLTSFVNDQQRLLLQESKVSDECLVIDGKALLHFLYHENNLDVRYGGNYLSFRLLVKDFIQKLRICNIKPIVVIDGGCSMRKQNTKLARQQENVEIACNIMDNYSEKKAQIYRLLPPMTTCVFCQTLHEMEIPVVRSAADADRETAAVANVLGAAVLSNDSDFYTLDVISGYFPLAHFNWKETRNNNGSHSMHGLRYHRNALSSAYKLDDTMLAFLSILLGSDWLPQDTFFHFLNQIIRGGRAAQRVDAILRWLSKHKDKETVVDTLMRQVEKKQRQSVLEKVRWCLSFYSTLPRVDGLLRHLENQSNGTLRFDKTFTGNDDDAQLGETSHTQTPELTEILACGDIPTFVVSLFTNDGRTPLPVFLTKQHKLSSHVQCTQARQSLYRILAIRNFLPQDITIVEFDRVGILYEKKSALKLTKLKGFPCDCYAMLSSYDDFTAEQRRCFMVESVLGCKVSNEKSHLFFNETVDQLHKLEKKFCSRFEVLWMSTVAWMKGGVEFALAITLIVVLVHGCLEDGKSRNLLVTAFNAGNSDNFNHVDDVSRWQCWIQIAIALNCTLGFPCSRATFGVFDCETVASVYNQVITWRKHRLLEEVNQRLTSLPRTRRILSLLSSAIKRHVQ